MIKRMCLLLIALVACSPLAMAQSAPTAKSRAVAFVNVNVIPMDRERILEKQTVVVRDGRIAEVGPANRVKIPADAMRVEAAGKYLIPGLAEMHGHLPGPNTPEAVTNAFLKLFVANGVTTVRGMFGFPNHVALRDRVAKGEILGPRLFVAGPALSGQSVTSPEVGAKLVREYKQAGFDLLKIHEGLSPESYEAIVKTAREVGIPFGGHIPDSIGLLGALQARQISIDHIDGYIQALEADDSPIKNAPPQERMAKLHLYLDEKKLPALVAKSREAGVWIVPTHALYQTFLGTESVESLRKRPELAYVPAQMVDQWAQHRTAQLQNPIDPAAGRRMLELRDKALDALADGGVGILLGSDAPQLFSVPGFSLQHEMEAMVRAGMTPYQVLESGTRNPAVYFGALSDFGTVEAGKRADLILLDANPLADIGNMANRAGVMLNGRWMPQAELRKMLEESAQAVK